MLTYKLIKDIILDMLEDLESEDDILDFTGGIILLKIYKGEKND